MAYIYIEHHIDDLIEREAALKLHAKYRQPSVEGSLRAHVRAVVDTHYPEKRYGSEGAMIPEMVDMLAAAEVLSNQQKSASASESAFEVKQSTMPDAGLIPTRR